MAIDELVDPAREELRQIEAREKEIAAQLGEVRAQKRRVRKVVEYLTGERQTGPKRGSSNGSSGTYVGEDRRKVVRDAVREIGPASASEIDRHIGRSEGYSSPVLKALREDEEVRLHSHRPRGKDERPGRGVKLWALVD